MFRPYSARTAGRVAGGCGAGVRPLVSARGWGWRGAGEGRPCARSTGVINTRGRRGPLDAGCYASSAVSAGRHSRRTPAAGMPGQWASTLRSCRRNAHRGGRSRSRPLPQMPSRTVAAGPNCGARATAYGGKSDRSSGCLCRSRKECSAHAHYAPKLAPLCCIESGQTGVGLFTARESFTFACDAIRSGPPVLADAGSWQTSVPTGEQEAYDGRRKHMMADRSSGWTCTGGAVRWCG